MTDERKKLIHEFFTEIYRFHLDYADLDNLSPDSEEKWSQYIKRVDELIDRMEEKGADELDLFIMRKQVAIQMNAIEKVSIERARKKQEKMERLLGEKRRER